MTTRRVEKDSGHRVADTVRQVAVLLTVVLAAAAAYLGSGTVIGTPLPEIAEGALSSTATLVAPATPAFAIWAPIYLGLLLLALLQAMPSRAADTRQRRTGWWVAASAALNALWLLVIQLGWIAVGVVVIVALLLVLVVVLVRLGESSARTTYERVVLDATMGLYLGWVCVATIANVASALVVAGAMATGGAAVAIAVVVLVVAACVGIVLAVTLHGRLAPALALAWGLAWIAVARTSGEPLSAAVAVTAAGAALVTLLSAYVERARSRPSPSRQVGELP